MPKFLIDRSIPGVAEMSPQERHSVWEKSCEVLRSLPEVQWLQSYVTADRVTCVYIAPNAELVREHARRGGFPADEISQVRAIVDPTSAEATPVPAQ